MRVTTYQKELSKLDRSTSINDCGQSTKSKQQKCVHMRTASAQSGGRKTTFRRQMFKDELTLKPQVNNNVGKFLKRHKSTGNICADLYQDSVLRSERAAAQDR